MGHEGSFRSEPSRDSVGSPSGDYTSASISRGSLRRSSWVKVALRACSALNASSSSTASLISSVSHLLREALFFGFGSRSEPAGIDAGSI